MNIRKHILAAGSIFFLSLSAAGLLSSSCLAADSMTVSARQGVNVRSAASTEAEVIGGFPYGTQVEVTGKEKKWYKVDLNGKTGYIYAEYLTDADNDLVVVNCADGANLRAKASKDSNLLICVPAGTILTVEKEKSGWCAVTYSGFSGFIRKDLLNVYNAVDEDEEDDEDEVPANTVKKIKKKKMHVNCYDGVNIRSDAGPGYERLGGLQYEDTVTVTGEKDGWFEVKFDGGTGFIYQEWLSEGKGNSTSSGSDSGLKVGKKATVTEDLNLRTKASTDARVIRVLPAGTKVTILQKEGDWYIVEYDGESGACYGEFLKQ